MELNNKNMVFILHFSKAEQGSALRIINLVCSSLVVWLINHFEVMLCGMKPSDGFWVGNWHNLFGWVFKTEPNIIHYSYVIHPFTSPTRLFVMDNYYWFLWYFVRHTFRFAHAPEPAHIERIFSPNTRHYSFIDVHPFQLFMSSPQSPTPPPHPNPTHSTIHVITTHSILPRSHSSSPFPLASHNHPGC